MKYKVTVKLINPVTLKANNSETTIVHARNEAEAVQKTKHYYRADYDYGDYRLQVTDVRLYKESVGSNKTKRYPSLKEAFLDKNYETYAVQRNLDRGNWEGPGPFGPSAKDVDFGGTEKRRDKIEEPPTKKEAVETEPKKAPWDANPAVGALERSPSWKDPMGHAKTWGLNFTTPKERAQAQADKERQEKENPKKEGCGGEVHNEHCGCPGGETDDMNAFTLGRVGAPGGPDLSNKGFTNFGVGELADEEDIILYDTDFGHREDEEDSSLPKEGKYSQMGAGRITSLPGHIDSLAGSGERPPEGDFKRMRAGDIETAPEDQDDLELMWGGKQRDRDRKRRRDFTLEGKTKKHEKHEDDEDDDDKKLVSHQGLDMSRWEQRVHIGSEDDEDGKKGVWRNKTWEGFGRGDYKMKKEARGGLPKMPGGGPEYEDDPHMAGDEDIYDIDPTDLEPETDMEIDRPEDEEYIQSLIKHREFNDGAERVQDFGRFIDPDEIPW